MREKFATNRLVCRTLRFSIAADESLPTARRKLFIFL